MSNDPAESNNEIATIEQTMRSDIAAYERDGRMQGRYLELLRAKESGTAAPPGPTAADAERRDLEKLLGDPSSAYWKGPLAAEKQARYRELVEADLASARSREERLSEAAEARADDDSTLTLPRGASETDLAVYRIAADVLRHMPPDRRASFEAGFNQLPPAVLAASRAELADRAPMVASVGQEDVELFATKPEGAELVKEWGPRAPAKLARLRGRLERWRGRMPADAQAAAADWLEGLSPAEAKALYAVVTA